MEACWTPSLRTYLAPFSRCCMYRLPWAQLHKEFLTDIDVLSGWIMIRLPAEPLVTPKRVSEPPNAWSPHVDSCVTRIRSHSSRFNVFIVYRSVAVTHKHLCIYFTRLALEGNATLLRLYTSGTHAGLDVNIHQCQPLSHTICHFILF